jgi:hypothetical protein
MYHRDGVASKHMRVNMLYYQVVELYIRGKTEEFERKAG